jgi:hypothetical protein
MVEVMFTTSPNQSEFGVDLLAMSDQAAEVWIRERFGRWFLN